MEAVYRLPNKKTSDLCGVLVEVLKEVTRRKPEVIFKINNKYLNQGVFP